MVPHFDRDFEVGENFRVLTFTRDHLDKGANFTAYTTRT